MCEAVHEAVVRRRCAARKASLHAKRHCARGVVVREVSLCVCAK